MRQAPREHTVRSRGTIRLVTLEMVLVGEHVHLTRINRDEIPGGQYGANGGTLAWFCDCLMKACRSRTLRRQKAPSLQRLAGRQVCRSMPDIYTCRRIVLVTNDCQQRSTQDRASDAPESPTRLTRLRNYPGTINWPPSPGRRFCGL
jgi:hypothetical protein